jgi:peptidyl-dipeptidase Dcp
MMRGFIDSGALSMRPLSLTIGVLASLFFLGCSDRESAKQAVTESAEPMNPFFDESPLPYGMPLFDRIENEHYVPAFERGMAEQSAEIEAIVSNPEAPTFENTIVAMERTGKLLRRTRRVFSNLTGTHTNDTLKQIQTEMSPRLAAHIDNILLNPDLFARVLSLYDARDSLGLDAESLRLLERYHLDFVRAGAELSEEQKSRLREINAEIAELRTAFSQNVLNEVNDSAVVVESRDDLAGLTDSQIESAAKEAESRDHEGQYILTLQNTTQQPPLTTLENRQLRQRIQELARRTRDAHRLRKPRRLYRR